MNYEYYNWQCAYYKATNYIDYLYKLDGNFTSNNGTESLSNCIDLYLSNLPEFISAEKYCALADKYAPKTNMQASISNILGTSIFTLMSVSISLLFLNTIF